MNDRLPSVSAPPRLSVALTSASRFRLRTVVRTVCPALSSCRMQWLAMKPDPPVTKIVLTLIRCACRRKVGKHSKCLIAGLRGRLSGIAPHVFLRRSLQNIFCSGTLDEMAEKNGFVISLCLSVVFVIGFVPYALSQARQNKAATKYRFGLAADIRYRAGLRTPRFST